MRNHRFTFLCSHEERQLIAALAKRLERTQSDAVRLLIREAVRGLKSDLLHADFQTKEVDRE